MTNEIAQFNLGAMTPNPAALVEGLQNVNSALSGSTGGMLFMRLTKAGVFAYGPESIEPEVGSEWAINSYSIMHGLACWGDGELLDERMVPFNEAPPNVNDMPDYGQSWGQQVSFQMQCMTGEDSGVTVLYKGTSTGLRTAVKTLIDEIVAQAKVDPEHVIPVVELEVDSYKHKKYGQIFTPQLNIVKWVSIDNATDASEPDEEPEPSKPEAEAAKAEGKPNRRRRRAN